MKKTKIDWADSTWNPVTGCLHGCEYCYARKIAERFGGYKRIEDLLCPKEYPKDCGICKACNKVLNEPVRCSDTYEYMRMVGISAGKIEPYPFGFSPRLQFASKEERDKFNADFNAKTQRMIDAKQVSVKIVDFCLQPDCEGKIHYGACKEILKVIGDYDDDIAYGYAGRKDCAMFRDFKALLQECVDNRCMLTWW